MNEATRIALTEKLGYRMETSGESDGWRWWVKGSDPPICYSDLPDPLTDANDAKALREKLVADGWRWILHRGGARCGVWRATDSDHEFTGCGKDENEATVRAACAAWGIEREALKDE